MKWFNNQKVSVKVLLSSMVFIVLIIAISVQGILGAKSASKGFNNFYTDSFEPVKEINEILQSWSQIQINMMSEMDAAGKNNDFDLSALWTAQMDARNYIVLGDPAVRFDV